MTPRRRRARPVAVAVSLALAPCATGADAAPFRAPRPVSDAALLPAQGLKAPADPAADGATEADAPPPAARPPPAASFPSASAGFPGAALGLPGAALSFGSAQVAAGSTQIAAPQGQSATGSAATAQGQAEDGPPAETPLGAVFGSAGIAFQDAPMRFADSHVAVGDAHLAALPSGIALREEGGALRVTLDADVLFDFDRAELRKDAGPRLQRLMEAVSARIPRPAFRVEGHTDSIGSDAYNLRLSGRRADSVREWLVRRGGVPRPAVSTAGYGESRPVAANATPEGRDDPEGRQRNRRVELLVTPR